jgi:hypothetical protein
MDKMNFQPKVKQLSQLVNDSDDLVIEHSFMRQPQSLTKSQCNNVFAKDSLLSHSKATDSQISDEEERNDTEMQQSPTLIKTHQTSKKLPDG